jgi:hypothetical protein
MAAEAGSAAGTAPPTAWCHALWLLIGGRWAVVS